MKKELANAMARIQILETQNRIMMRQHEKSRIRITEYGHHDLFLPDNKQSSVKFGHIEVSFDPHDRDMLVVRAYGGQRLQLYPHVSNEIGIKAMPR